MSVTIKKQYGRELKEHTLYTKEELNSMFGGNIIKAGEAVGRTAELSNKLNTLDSDIDQSITDAFTEAGFFYDDQINEINDHISDLLDGKVTLDNAYNEVVISESDGILVTGYDDQDVVSRINLRGSGSTQDGHSIAGIYIQKNLGVSGWATTFWVNDSGDIFMNGNLQLAEGSVLVGTRDDPVVFISQEASFDGITVTGASSRTVIGEGQDDESTTFAGIAIQELVGSDWVSNFYANSSGDVYLRGEINATSGVLGDLTITGELTIEAGEITNQNEDYTLDSSGLSFVGSPGFENESAISWIAGAARADIYGAQPSTEMLLYHRATENIFETGAGKELVSIRDGRFFIDLDLLPTSDPNDEGALFVRVDGNDGAELRVSDG